MSSKSSAVKLSHVEKVFVLLTRHLYDVVNNPTFGGFDVYLNYDQTACYDSRISSTTNLQGLPCILYGYFDDLIITGRKIKK